MNNYFPQKSGLGERYVITSYSIHYTKLYDDLAMEAAQAAGNIPGVEVLNDEVMPGVNRSRVTVINEEGEKAIGKKKGIYVTIEAQQLARGDAELDEHCAIALANEIRSMAGDALNGVVLVVGLVV